MDLRIGFIGTGKFAEKHMRILSQMEGVTIAAICGRTSESAERSARQWPDAKAYGNTERMLDECKPDAVYICVPPMAHGEIEMSLAERGIPFFVEKPLAIKTETIAAVRDKVAGRRLVTAVGYNWRYLDSVAKARELQQKATTGMALGYWMGGMPSTPWWRRQEGSGGQFVEQSTHLVDLIRYLCGEIEEVYAAFGRRVVHETYEGADVADVGSVTMKVAGGIVATIANTCMLPRGHRTGLDLYTSSGVLEIRSAGLMAIGRDRTTEYRNGTDPYVQENAAFLHAVLTGDTSRIRSDYADAFRSFEVTAAANLSAEEGRPVRL